jgi:hypothetical protein
MRNSFWRNDMWRSEFWDEFGETFFVVAVALAIGIGAANLAIQVNKERAAFDAAVGKVEIPPAS